MNAYVVEKQALLKNIEILRKRMGNTLIWGVLKGDGYGIGAVELAHLLYAQGIDHFAVCDLQEARALRDAGFDEAAIFMMRCTADPTEIDELLDLRVILSVGSAADAKRIDALAAQRSCVAEAHLKIDTGMGRFGFLPDETSQMISVYANYKHLAVTGVYTHFHSAHNPKRTEAQFVQFQNALEVIRAAGYEPGMVHCCNSTAAWRYGAMRCDGVRIGSALLGRVGWAARAGLTPIGYCEASIEALRTLPAGHTVGYACGYKAKEDTPIAVVGVGWCNGFGVDRGFDLWRPKDCLRGVGRYLKALLQKKALYVTIGGKPCKVLGHVGMVNMVVDVSGLRCKLGDPVVVPINPVLQKNLEIVYR